jgi:hypothetical protein
MVPLKPLVGYNFSSIFFTNKMQNLTNESFLNKPIILIVELESPIVDLSIIKVDLKHIWKRTYDLK